MVVEVGCAVHGIDHEKNHVGLLDGEGHLAVDFRFKDVIGIDNPTAGIDN